MNSLLVTTMVFEKVLFISRSWSFLENVTRITGDNILIMHVRNAAGRDSIELTIRALERRCGWDGKFSECGVDTPFARMSKHRRDRTVSS